MDHDQGVDVIESPNTRMIPGLKGVPYEIRLKRLKLWTLEGRRVRADLIEVFRMFRGLSVVDIDTFLPRDAL